MENAQSPENCSNGCGSYKSWSEWLKFTNSNIQDGILTKWFRSTTEYSLHMIRKHFEQYRLYVEHNPLLVSEIESALYWISYLLFTTRFHNSRVISELLYSCSSLLTLFNDNILRRSYGSYKNSNTSLQTFHTILQFIEYVQVFVELTAIQFYGQYGKWVVISIIEIIKSTIRLLLLFYYQQGLTRHQYILPLNRQREYEKYQFMKKNQNTSVGSRNSSYSSSSSSIDEAIFLNDNEPVEEEEGIVLCEDNEKIENKFGVGNHVFQLKSSGRIIRNIDQAPPKEKRMWLTPKQTFRLKRLLQKNHRTSPTITQLNRRRLIGELLHILRPAIHLTTGVMVGGIQDRWTPYLVSLGLDIVSLHLLQGSSFQKYHLDPSNLRLILDFSSKNHKNDINSNDQVDQIWNWSEHVEIQRRYLSLFMYLLRSPFYDKYTKRRLIQLLSLFADYIPLFGRLFRPFIQYLPQWQQVYFYIYNS